MRVRRLAAAGTAALLLPFAACSDGDSNAEPVEPTGSATPSPSETASEGPTLPPEAQGNDQAAAKAFVKFYFELISDAMVTGDIETLRSFSDPACKSCNALMDRIANVYDKNGSFQTAGWRPTKLVPDPIDEANQFAYFARIAMRPRQLLDADGKQVAAEKAATQGMHLLVQHADGRWTMRRMGLLQ